MQYYPRLAYEQGEGKERGKGKKGKGEPVGMPKDFDFHMAVIDVMFKLTFGWQAPQQQLIFE